MPLTIWIDGDAVPGEIKELVLRASRRLALPVRLVANKHLDTGPSPLVTLVRVGKGPDAADAYIVDQAAPGDFCVTADIPLAAALVDKGLTVLDPRGEQFSPENVRERLAIRDFMAGLREAGVQTGGPSAFGPKAKQRFAALFDSLLSRALRGP